MPHTPNGWYGVLRSHELAKGKVLPLTVFGRQLVAFRGKDGDARVLSAFCPHLGAHLGHGGKVRGNEIECPFHAWRFAGDGRCSHAPFSKRTPDVGVRAWKVIERTGVVYVWIHALGAEPTYEPPAVPQFEGLRGWGEARELRGRYRIHIQELRENIVDEAHFQHIHRQKEPPLQTFEASGPYAEMRQELRVFDIEPSPLKIEFTAKMYGPGVMDVSATGPMNLRALALTTPLDEGYSEMRLLSSLENPLGSRILGALLRWYYSERSSAEVSIEEKIWDNKTHLPRPVFLPHEKGIRRLRDWYQQFYEGAAAATEASPPRRLVCVTAAPAPQ